MSLELTAEEIEVIERGREFAELKAHPAWKKVIAWCVSHCNSQLDRLQNDENFEAIATARLVDRWKASEEFYQNLVGEVESAIRAGKEKEAELHQLGIDTTLMQVLDASRYLCCGSDHKRECRHD